MSTSTGMTAPPGEVAALTVTAGRPWRKILVAVLLAELAILFAPTVIWLLDRWTLSVWQHAHGLLIPPVVAYFAYQELRPLAARPASASAWGFAFLVPALALHALDAGMHTQLLSAFAMMLALPGLSLLLLGAERTRAIAFPLAFLAFSLPIPLAFTEQIHWQLRQLATAATAAVVPWFGVPVFVEGTTLHMANGALEVADACSGFSTLYAAIAVACLTAYAATSTARRALVLLSAVPLALAANLLRVVGLVLLVVWQGPDILDTFLHPLSGMLTFVLVLPVIFWLGGDGEQQVHS
ncbi:MAG TPA: exosortase/archaeosortase family protein [Vicinamibacterales bacterium]|nr:exosortase/archaeosortase family protein [Vicinamibacterales bacterium]